MYSFSLWGGKNTTTQTKEVTVLISDGFSHNVEQCRIKKKTTHQNPPNQSFTWCKSQYLWRLKLISTPSEKTSHFINYILPVSQGKFLQNIASSSSFILIFYYYGVTITQSWFFLCYRSFSLLLEIYTESKLLLWNYVFQCFVWHTCNKYIKWHTEVSHAKTLIKILSAECLRNDYP